MKSNRIKVVRKLLNLTQAEFAKELGKTLRMVQYYESGKSNIDDGVLLRLQEVFSVNTKWMQTGKGGVFLVVSENFETSSPLEEFSTPNDYDRELKGITLRYFPDVHASAGSGFLNTDENSKPFIVNGEFITDEFNEVIINISGDSMEPTFKNNDKILVNIGHLKHELLADRLYVVLTENEVIVKRYGGRTGSVCQFSSDNSIYKSFMIDFEDESNQIIGIVTGLLYRKL